MASLLLELRFHSNSPARLEAHGFAHGVVAALLAAARSSRSARNHPDVIAASPGQHALIVVHQSRAARGSG
jgi:hypothetical protein